ncbi:hypothetical protein [Streptomyces sulphureus]|uniref:hypothetical protein n=1 Tax=Streptomyces sulphureus TaxID=47758 RepID=UPI000371528D|nr:hypothetical protein [Streptomyces sulphureus]
MLATIVRRSTTALLALAGAAAFAPIPMSSAQAAPQQAGTSAAACAQGKAAAKGLVCYLNHCDPNWCYCDCYPTLAAKQEGKKPASTKKVAKPQGKPAATISG